MPLAEKALALEEEALVGLGRPLGRLGLVTVPAQSVRTTMIVPGLGDPVRSRPLERHTRNVAEPLPGSHG
ncbi:hypothetical protein GCM10027203_37330 [Nonomuraea fastidiosa]